MLNRTSAAWICWDMTHRQINSAFAEVAPDGYVLQSFVAFKFGEADYPDLREAYANWYLDMHPEQSFVDVGGLPVPVYLANQEWMSELLDNIVQNRVNIDDPCPCASYNFTPGVTEITECR